MHWLDTLLLVLLGLGALLGLWTGFLWQVARLLSLSLALTATVCLNEPTSQLLRDNLLAGAEPRVAQVVAYIAVFLLAYLLIFYVARLVHHGVRTSDLEWLDRVLGCVFGLAKFALILSGLCLLAAHYPHPTAQAWLKESTLAPLFAKGLESGLTWVPERYRVELADGVAGLHRILGGKEKDN
jgi:membrane protein required for colicin V production